MEGTRYTKKRSSLGKYQEKMNKTALSNNESENINTMFETKEGNKRDILLYKHIPRPVSINRVHTERIPLFQTWSFGTINIRSGKEKEEGAKIYAVAKEVNRAGLLFCCLQEVRYRGTGSKLIELDTGESYEFHWCGQKRRREAGVGILVKVQAGIEINIPDVNDPRIMAINLRINGFNMRIVNGYSPTNSGGSDSQKNIFYRSLKAACVKTHKHQKLVIMGDLNATTNIATYKSCYDGIKILEDLYCNDNGSRLKAFCRSIKLSIASTFFEYPISNRYTWYSNNKRTRKIIDFVLVEQFVQQYVTDCRAEPNYDFDSDHRLLKTTLCTPSTRRARRRPKIPPKKALPDIKALHNSTTQNLYVKSINRKLAIHNCINHQLCPTELSTSIIDTINLATNEILPGKPKQITDRQLWKNDTALNSVQNL